MGLKGMHLRARLARISITLISADSVNYRSEFDLTLRFYRLIFLKGICFLNIQTVICLLLGTLSAHSFHLFSSFYSTLLVPYNIYNTAYTVEIRPSVRHTVTLGREQNKFGVTITPGGAE